jgi:DNA-binding XRE family transcriptional regulator
MIYLINFENKFLKIGYTNHIRKRLSTLQVSIPIKLEVLALIEGDYEKERELHKLFHHLSENGEWFQYDSIITDYFKSQRCLMWQEGITPKENNAPLVGLVKTERRRQELSLEEFAQMYGTTKQSILDIETREVQGRVTLNTLYKVAKVLNKKLEYRFVDL